MKPNATTKATFAALLLAAAVCTGAVGIAVAETVPGPKWTSDGQLEIPLNYHEWIFLGSPLTPNGLNGGKAGFPEFHNVYVRPDALRVYRKTGVWPEGTMMLKELQLTLPGTNPNGSSVEPSGVGYFPGTRNGLDISVKDTKRFKDTNGWGYFTVGHHAPPYAKTAPVAAKEMCAGCHIANATADMVFTKFYAPILGAKSE
jgi:hypothetical protein